MSEVRLRSGIVALTRDASAALVATVRELGYQVLRVSLEEATTKAAVLAALADALAFPSYFGGNWDALADCLRDLDFAGGEGLLVVLDGLDALESSDAASAATLLEILDEASVDHAVHGRVLAFARLVG